MNARSLVVSIHDVSPFTRATVERMIAGLRGIGVARTSLLVIPNHHERGHFLDDADFCAWLRMLENNGHEVVIHGYFHLRRCKEAERFVDRAMTRFYTAGEGEFYDMDEEPAFELVTKAQREFAAAGLAPTGFIAPAWLLSGPAEKALRRAGIAYTTRLGGLLDLRTGEWRASQSMVYSVRSAWRRQTSLAWNSLLFRRLRSNPLLRLGLHPPDLEWPRIWAHASRHIARALEDREGRTYRSLM